MSRVSRIREAAYGDSVDALETLRVLVRPRDVVARAGRQHVHVVQTRHPLGDQPAVVLRTPENVEAVSLDDKGNSHRSGGQKAESTELSRRRMIGSPKSCSRRRWPSMISSRGLSSNASMPSSSAAYSRSFGANWRPAPPSVSGTAASLYARTGHVHRHRLDQRYAESLVLAQRNVDARRAIVRGELGVGHRLR